MKVLLGNKLHDLKDCIGYTTRPYLNSYTLDYLIYERHEKPSLVTVFGALDDLRFYNVKYIDFNEYVKERNMIVDDNKNICSCPYNSYNSTYLCTHLMSHYFRFDKRM